MVGLPAQAFAISLSDSAIEDMIKRVQNGEGIQLSLGENPVSRTPRIWPELLWSPLVVHNCTIASIGESCAIVCLALNHQHNKLLLPFIYYFSCRCNPLQFEQSTDRIEFRLSSSATEISKSPPNFSNTTSSDLPKTTPQQSPSFRSPPCRSSVPRGT